MRKYRGEKGEEGRVERGGLPEGREEGRKKGVERGEGTGGGYREDRKEKRRVDGGMGIERREGGLKYGITVLPMLAARKKLIVRKYRGEKGEEGRVERKGTPGG